MLLWTLQDIRDTKDVEILLKESCSLHIEIVQEKSHMSYYWKGRGSRAAKVYWSSCHYHVPWVPDTEMRHFTFVSSRFSLALT